MLLDKIYVSDFNKESVLAAGITTINGIVFMTESGDLYSGFYNVATNRFIGFIAPVTDGNTKLKEIESNCIEWFAKMPSNESENKSTKKDSRTVIKLNAKSKIEAMAALDLMSQTVENIKTIMNPISLTVEITNEEEEK